MIETVLLLVSVEVEAQESALDRALTTEFRDVLYDFDDREQVLNHLAYNCVKNGIEDATRLDGWADLPEGTVTMRISLVQPG